MHFLEPFKESPVLISKFYGLNRTAWKSNKNIQKTSEACVMSNIKLVQIFKHLLKILDGRNN